MVKRLLILLIGIVMTINVSAQEFLCNINIQSQKVTGVDKSVFDALQTSMFEFMNNRKWSSRNFKMEERIECTMLFTINEVVSSDEFTGTLNVVLQRPIYKTDYASPVINLVDKDIHFRYIPYQSMEYADNTYSSNLTSILAYYAYLMLGLDSDTFSPLGGTEYYEKAQTVVNSAQSAPEKGWQAFEGPKNRNQLVAGLINPSYEDLRNFLYEYHRLGFDNMSENVESSRSEIVKTIMYFKNINNKRPGLYPMQIFIETKRDEIVSLFSKATPAEKTAVINIMKEVDPANSSTYQDMNK
jgi:hypothetical protein